ncbi:MAG: hypothetical protein V4516_04580 [Pseudomonadota bacterium]
MELESADDVALADKMNAGRKAIIAELQKQIVGQAEVLGKARLLRATVRAGSVATELVAGLAGLFTALGVAIAGAVHALLLRGLRRLVR